MQGTKLVNTDRFEPLFLYVNNEHCLDVLLTDTHSLSAEQTHSIVTGTGSYCLHDDLYEEYFTAAGWIWLGSVKIQFCLFIVALVV